MTITQEPIASYAMGARYEVEGAPLYLQAEVTFRFLSKEDALEAQCELIEFLETL